MVELIRFYDRLAMIQFGCQRRLYQQLLVDQRVQYLFLQLRGERHAGGSCSSVGLTRYTVISSIYVCQHVCGFCRRKLIAATPQHERDQACRPRETN